MTIAIIGLITTLVMVRYSSFNSAVLLKNQAYEIALDIREAQVFAISVRGAGNQFREEYGLFFNHAQPDEYIFWLDNDANTGNVPQLPPRLHRVPAVSEENDETIELRKFDNRFELIDICVNNDSECRSEQDLSSSNRLRAVHMSFARPDFDASFQVNGLSASTIQDIRLIIAPTNDPTITRSVVVTAAGQITVE